MKNIKECLAILNENENFILEYNIEINGWALYLLDPMGNLFMTYKSESLKKIFENYFKEEIDFNAKEFYQVNSFITLSFSNDDPDENSFINYEIYNFRRDETEEEENFIKDIESLEEYICSIEGVIDYFKERMEEIYYEEEYPYESRGLSLKDFI